MYNANDLKLDVLANIKTDSTFPPLCANILETAEFVFNDTHTFTRIVWNTYERYLVIFCASEDKSELEKYQDSLYSLCNKIHGTRDNYIIMSLEIIAKNGIVPVSTNSSINSETITINTQTIINRTNNNIGHGGFGEVYKYYDEEKEEVLAYKIYQPHVFQTSDSETMKKRFIREGKKLLSYSHPNIVKAYDYGFLGDESAYIKMEFISGSCVSDYIMLNPPESSLTEKLCLQYIDAMAYVHSKTDLHRDISYSNVMITKTNEIKVLDFGFARNSKDTNYDTVYKDIQRKFVLPNEPYTFKTEVYCIGAILYTLITRKLFDDSFNIASLDSVECDNRLKEATKICLALKPEERFENAVELQKYIEANSSPITPSFSLDNFKDIVSRGVELHFTYGNMPTYEAIKQWVETDFKDMIESCTFQSTINLLTLLQRLPHLKNITYYKNKVYDLDKSLFVSMYDFYNNLTDDIKTFFIKNIRLIVNEKSKADELEDEELPFS